MIIKIFIEIILFEIIVVGLIYIKHLFYGIFKGFWEEQAEYWEKQYKDLKYDYDKIAEEFREKFGKGEE